MIAEILANLDRMCHLYAALLTHPMFLVAWKSCQQQILEGIVSQQIPSLILPLAISTLEADSIDYEDWEKIYSVLHSLDNVEQSSLLKRMSPLTPQRVMALERTHLAVCHFSFDFASQSALAFNNIFEIRGRDLWSASERLRFYRAFYRFQLYCNIWGRKLISSVREASRSGEDMAQRSYGDLQRELNYFFWPWPPWVNEQLASIFEYLERKLSIRETLS
jgi:hypothetical protein